MLQRRLGTSAAVSSGGVLVGVEQELRVCSRGRPQDFRTLLAGVSGDGLRIDPGDPRARRLPSGLVLTADGWEAELVTPPVVVGRGAPVGVDELLERGRAQLLGRLRVLDPAVDLVGFSTHVNVTVADELVVTVAGEFARRCSVATMLVLDGLGSPGLLVRPRRGRLEVGGEYAEGADLVAAVTVVAGCAGLLVASLSTAGVRLPRVLGQRVVPARERYGHFVGRGASGCDVYRGGRASPLVLDGDPACAQEHLEEVWELARPFALGLGLDPDPVDALVSGRRPLRIERGGLTGMVGGHRPGSGSGTPVPAPDLRARQVGRVRVTPAWATWSRVAWRCQGPGGRVAYAVLPARDQGRFLSLLDEGALDEVIAKALRRSWARRVLVTSDQADRAGMWHDLHPQGLVPAERDLAGLLTRAGRGGSGHRDDAKQRADESSPSTPGGGQRLPLRLVAVLVAGALLLGAGLATAVAMTRARAETTPPPVVAASASEAAPAPGTSSGTSPASEPSPTAPATSAAPPPSPAPTTAPNPIPISTGGATAPPIDPALDPARIYGYRVTSTRTLVKVGNAAIIPANEQVGSIDQTFWRCLAGTCKAGPWTFTAASPDVSQTYVENAFLPCGPATVTLAIVRAPDGTYTGTLSVTPRATYVAVPGTTCTYPQTVDALSLEPVIKLAPGAAPNASLPAALDPVRITGYQGTSSADGKTTAATVTCEGGVCQLRCLPVCATPVVVQAAADTWSAEGLNTHAAACQGGTTSLKLVRAADGSYTGKATTTYVGEPKQGCATSTSFSLQPVTR